LNLKFFLKLFKFSLEKSGWLCYNENMLLKNSLKKTDSFLCLLTSVLALAKIRTAQHSTAQHSTAQHSTAQHSTALAISLPETIFRAIRVLNQTHRRAARLPCSHSGKLPVM